ncbi:MAG: DegV family EDD domain-containing protein [Eubacterium sp.]|nr:DegV family EDD domain-containing protein [Eubacterium sp.]
MKETYRKIRRYLGNSDIDIRERLFMFLAVIALFGIFLAGICGPIIGENLESVVVCGISFVVFLALTIIGFKTNHIIAVSYVVAFILVFIFLPVNFFTSGAIHGGAAIWNVFDAMYISLCLRGKPRIIFLSCEAVVVGVIYYLYANYPALTLPHTEETAFQDSLASFFLVCFILILMITLQTVLYRKENETAKNQKNEIDELNKAQNRFFSSMSHEIRTPINTIIGLNEMILRENASDEINEDAENIQAAGKMLLHLINDILDMSKFQSGQMELVNSPYFTKDMVADVARMILVRAKEKNLKFIVDISPELPREMIGDQMRMEQILINVLNNAVKYTKQGSVTLTVHCEELDADTVNTIFTVTDTGIGIHKESIPVLFDAFKRIDEDKNNMIEGTGLGLSIVKQFVDMMGGKITVNSVYTKGSTFIIEIPQKKSGEEKVGEIDLDEKHVSVSQTRYRSSFTAPEAKVLVVDDTPANLMVVAKLLRETRVQVTTVSNGEEALEKTLENEFHVIFMDHKMPGMDGIECFHRIRTQTGGMCKDSKVVVLTANAGGDNAALYAREGFDGYVVKPVSGRALEEELLKQLPRNIVTIADEKEDIKDKSKLWRDEHRMRSVVTITTDSVSSIPKEFERKYNIPIIPVRIDTKDGLFRDMIDINSYGILDYMFELNKPTTVRPIEPERFESFFADNLRDTRNIIHISLASGVKKSSYPAAVEASKTFENVTVYDSEHFGGAAGLLVIKACEMASAGDGPEKIIQELDNLKKKIKSQYLVGSLEQLAVAGQIRKSTYNVVKSLSLRPVVELRKNKMRIHKLYIGSKRRAWKKYIKSALRDLSSIDRKLLIVNHVGLNPEDMQWIQDRIDDRGGFDRVIFQEASTAVAINCGLNSFSLVFVEKDIIGDGR